MNQDNNQQYQGANQQSGYPASQQPQPQQPQTQQQFQQIPQSQTQQSQQNYQQAPEAPAAMPVAESAPAPDTTAPKKAKKEKGTNPALIAIIVVLSVLLLGICGFLGFKLLNPSDDEDGKKEESADDENEEDDEKGSEDADEIDNVVVSTDEDADGEKTSDEDEKEEVKDTPVAIKGVEREEISVIELYPDRAVSKSDIEEFAGLIEERAKVLGDTFLVEYDSEKIVLTIEKELLGETAGERVHTMELLKSRGNISFGDNEYIDTYQTPSKDNIDEITVVEVDRVDLLLDYKANMVDKRYTQLESIKDSEIYALEIAFTKGGVEKISELVTDDAKYGTPKTTVAHDFDEDSYSKDDPFFANVFIESYDDFSTVLLVSPGASYEKNADLMKKILEQDEVDFGLVMSIKDEPNWETSGRNMGVNQKTSVSGATITAQITPDDYTREYCSEVEFAEYEKVVKERLDVLGIDYMFGTTGFDDKTYCVKLRTDEFAPDFFRLIFCRNQISVRSSFDNLYEFDYPELVVENGKPVLRLKTSATAEELLNEYTIPGNTLYLVVNDVTIASADVTSIKELSDTGYSYYKNCLDFENFLCFGDIEVSEEELNVLELVCSIADNDYVSYEGTFEFRNYTGGDASSLGDIEWKYATLTSEDERVMSIVNGMGHSIEKLVDQRNMLNIYIDLPVNDDLVEDFVSEVKAIYEACAFDGGAYNIINFIIVDEKLDSPADTFRFEVEKDTYSGKMTINDRVSGPKFNKYWSKMYDITEEDEFFTSRSYW